MFEWLESEIETIATPRFHVVDGPAEPKLRDAVINSPLSLPWTYVQFVLKFGNAKLYRSSRDGYKIGVFAGPRERILKDNSSSYQVGYYDGASIFIRKEDSKDSWSVFEGGLHTERKVASDFEEWLKIACTKTQGGYSAEEWSDIKRGPVPFSPEEEKIVETRKLIKWRVLGIDTSGGHIFEITNEGHHTLQFLTVGVRSKEGRMNGALRLKIGHVFSGKTEIIHMGCYKGIIQFTELEMFDLPDPQPEDRAYYSEFKVR